ncbi:MAG: efflux RND transporter periplasmic adaptor subunit [Pseudomonadota bacterium]
MTSYRWVCSLVPALMFIAVGAAPASESGILVAQGSGSREVSEPQRPSDGGLMRSDRINAVIYPVQSATISTEVRGLLDNLKVKEGEQVKQGDVLAEVSKARYEAVVGEFKGNYDAVVRTLERAREELVIQEELYGRRATTYDEVNKARSQIGVLEARKYEAEHKLAQAELNLKACIIKAPFTGAVAVLYHEPYEAVDNLEKVLGVVDTSKVFARANWPEGRLADLKIGKKAVFTYEGKNFDGVVERVSTLIDPASKSKRVHVLIENPLGKLQVGMSGTLNVAEDSRVSMTTEP